MPEREDAALLSERGLVPQPIWDGATIGDRSPASFSSVGGRLVPLPFVAHGGREAVRLTIVTGRPRQKRSFRDP